jgi:hypothetical protein
MRNAAQRGLNLYCTSLSMTATVVMILEDDGVRVSYLSTLWVLNKWGYRVTILTINPNVFDLFSNFGLVT